MRIRRLSPGLRFVALFVLSLSSAYSSDFSPTETHLVFDSFSSTQDPERVNAQGIIDPVRLIANPQSPFPILVSREQHEFERQYGNAVFETITGDHTGRGTSFLIGQDLVMTNLHVATSRSDCGEFKVKLNHRSEWVGCEKIEFCGGNDDDYCVIRLKPMQNGKKVGTEVVPLVLNAREVPSEGMYLVIGNALGLGIQASSEYGAKQNGWDIYTCARVYHGNSGSPFLNEKGEAVAVIRALTAQPFLYSCQGRSEYGLGTTMLAFVRDLRHHPEKKSLLDEMTVIREK